MELRCWRWLGLLSVVSVGCGVDPNEPIGEADQSLVSACPPSESVLGIDISSYQHDDGPIDWATVAKNRAFVIIKATEGTTYKNSYYAADIAAARANGMIAGAYHFLRFNRDGAAQADHFLASIGGTVPRGDLPPMVDVEDIDNNPDVSILTTWIDRVEQVTGRKPMIYSGNWYWSGYLGNPLGFGDHPIAWSSYTSACPTIPDDFSSLTIWQYLGDTGTTPGIQGACDQDKFYGSTADLLKLADSVPSFQGTPMGMESQSYPIVSQGAVKIELGATVTGWVQLKNTGSQTWKPGVVWLAPIPRDQPSALQAPSWLNDHRISTVTQEIAPGSVARFALDLAGTRAGRTTLSLGWVAENITWFADSPTGGGPKDGYYAVDVDVVAPPSGTGGAPALQGQGGSRGEGDNAEAGTATKNSDSSDVQQADSEEGLTHSGGSFSLDTATRLAAGAAGLAHNPSLGVDDDSGCNCAERPGNGNGPLAIFIAAIALLFRRTSAKSSVAQSGHM